MRQFGALALDLAQPRPCLQGQFAALSLDRGDVALMRAALALLRLALPLQAKQFVGFGLDLGRGNKVVAAQRLQPRLRLLGQSNPQGQQSRFGFECAAIAQQIGPPPLQRRALAGQQRLLLHGGGGQALLPLGQRALNGRLGVAAGRCTVERQHEQHLARAHAGALGNAPLQHHGILWWHEADHAAVGHQHPAHVHLARVLAQRQEGADGQHRQHHAAGQQRQRQRADELDLTDPRSLLRLQGFAAEDAYQPL